VIWFSPFYKYLQDSKMDRNNSVGPNICDSNFLVLLKLVSTWMYCMWNF
jgi:hypothetical protein